MKVVLPDNSELELPDGATGLDAARAIGPKLAEQAVLIRANGDVQDLRLPLRDGEPIQILTTRQGRPRRAVRPAPLVGAPPRRGGAAAVPGREGRDRPADRERLLLRLRVPEPIAEADLEKIEAEVKRELKEGREWTRERSRATRRKRASSERGAVQGRARRHRRGRHLSVYPGRLHRPLPRAAPAELEADQGGEADRARRRVLARRLGQAAAHADLRHRLLLEGGPRRASRAARGGAQARPPAARHPARPLPPLGPLAGLAVLAPEGDGDLEHPRGPAPPRERSAAATPR